VVCPKSAVNNTIPFHIEKQAATNWCWAAVAVSVSRYFKPASGWRQCGLATIVLRAADGDDAPVIPACGCCAKPRPRVCNQPWWLNEALDRVGCLRGKAIQGPLSFADIGRRIHRGKPVCVGIDWRGGGGHFVVISGCYKGRNGVRQLEVQDPWHGTTSSVRYSAFVSAYRRRGKWAWTYPV
jgi:hypothetical protein